MLRTRSVPEDSELDQPVVAVGAVAVVDDSLLMVLRSRAPEKGRWTLPGGRVNRGETLAQAVEREVLEETNLSVSCGPLRGWAERISSGYHFVILDFDVALRGTGEPRAGSDAARAAWVPLGLVASLKTTTGLVDFLRETQVLAPQ